jgi:transposase
MANVLKMADQVTIITLWRRGWSQRRIARETGLSRGTVARYIRLARAGWEPCSPEARSNCAIPITGSGVGEGPSPGAADRSPNDSNCAISITGSDGSEPASKVGDTGRSAGGDQGGNNTPEPVPGRQSKCHPFRDIIQSKLEAGLSAQRIWQDLRAEHEFPGSDQSVRRFCRRLTNSMPLPFRRLEVLPGTEAQIDFGTGAMVVIPDGQPLPVGVKTRRRKTHVLRVVLSHSRKAHSEAVFRQTTDEFIRCIENAFHHFGGVPETIVIDNLKAAVIQADWYDPEINPKFQSFCRHYGTAIMPTKPRTPRHKGKTERGVAYVQDNALKGRVFSSLVEQNEHLQCWEANVADTRIHGTTRKQVKQAFEEIEKPALLPLPPDRFPLFHEGKRKVNRDGHIEVDKSYYSVPPEYLGYRVWVRWDTRFIRIFNHRFEQVACHARQDIGRFGTDDKHVPDKKRSGVEKGAAHLLGKARLIGRHSGLWAEQLISIRGIEGVRPLLGLVHLTKKHESHLIERACETALSHGAYRLRTIRALIKRDGAKQKQFEFIQEHPIIRQMSDYGNLVHTAFTKERSA